MGWAVASAIFSKRLGERGGDNLLRAIEAEILDNPEAGDLIQGTGGVRKLRIANPARGKGKRGGFRALYLDLPRIEKTLLIYFYGKDESEDLSADQKKQIQELVRTVKETLE